MRKRYLPLLGLLACLSGCEIFYGVNREATLDTMPAADCVNRVLSSTPGIVHAEELPTLPDPQQNTSLSYQYRGAPGSHIKGILRLDQHAQQITLQDYIIYNHEKMPQTVLDATRLVMAQLERGLEQRCGLTGLSQHIKETCMGMDCSRPLPAATSASP